MTPTSHLGATQQAANIINTAKVLGTMQAEVPGTTQAIVAADSQQGE